MRTYPGNTGRHYQSIQARCAPGVHRQWREILALQRALDDKFYKVAGRRDRASRVMRCALALLRYQLVRHLAREGIDHRVVLEQAAAKIAAKGVEDPASMPNVDRPSQVEE